MTPHSTGVRTQNLSHDTFTDGVCWILEFVSCDSPSVAGCCCWPADVGRRSCSEWRHSCCRQRWPAWGCGGGWRSVCCWSALWLRRCCCWLTGCLRPRRCWWCGSDQDRALSLGSSWGLLWADNHHHHHHHYLQRRPMTRQCSSKTSWLPSHHTRPNETRQMDRQWAESQWNLAEATVTPASKLLSELSHSEAKTREEETQRTGPEVCCAWASSAAHADSHNMRVHTEDLTLPDKHHCHFTVLPDKVTCEENWAENIKMRLLELRCSCWGVTENKILLNRHNMSSFWGDSPESLCWLDESN